MNDTQALRLAITLARAEIQRLAFDANLRDRLNSDCPVTIKASEQRKTLRLAIECYEGMIKAGDSNAQTSNRRTRTRAR